MVRSLVVISSVHTVEQQLVASYDNSGLLKIIGKLLLNATKQ